MPSVPISVRPGLEERHDGVGDEAVERLDVVGHARDQDAGGPALVEADRQRLQVREDADAQVGERALADPADEVGLRVGHRPRRAAPRRRKAITTSTSVAGVVAWRCRRRSPRFASSGGASEAAVPSTSASDASARRARGRGAAARAARAGCAPRVPRRRALAGPLRARCGPAADGEGSQPAHLALARLAREEDLVGQPLLDDLAVELGGVEQLARGRRARRPRRARARRSRRRARSSRAGGR